MQISIGHIIQSAEKFVFLEPRIRRIRVC